LDYYSNHAVKRDARKIGRHRHPPLFFKVKLILASASPRRARTLATRLGFAPTASEFGVRQHKSLQSLQQLAYLP
jgi:hypothetical protein